MTSTTHVNFLSVIIPFAWLRISAIPPCCVAFSPVIVDIVVVVVSSSFQTNHGSLDEKVCIFALTFSIPSSERECVTPTLFSRIHFAKRCHPTFSLNFLVEPISDWCCSPSSLLPPFLFAFLASRANEKFPKIDDLMRRDGFILDDLRTFRINIS